jgi:adenylyl-sulfate kinase
MAQNSKCIWLTGLPCSGKTTLSDGLRSKLLKNGKNSVVLDGDVLRKSINSDLGFDFESRNIAMKRIAHIAYLLCSQNIITLVSVISPLMEHREYAKKLFEKKDSFYEIYISTSLEECERRDTKGMYHKARNREIKNFTGIDSKYDKPESPFMTLDTSEYTISESIDQIYHNVFNEI